MKNPWTVFFDWYKVWINDIRSTNHVIVIGVALAVIYVLWALLADTLGRPLTELTINTIGLFVSGMIAGGVAQFGIKRFSDDKVIAAKTGAALPARAGQMDPSTAPRMTTAVPRPEG